MYDTTCIQDNQGRAQYADYTLNDIPGTATNYLKTLAYGNGDGVKYDYDNQGRVITEEYGKNITSTSPTIGKTVSYGYDNSGYLASVTDSGSGITTKYFYDFAGRTSATEQEKNGTTLLKTALGYDGHGRLSRQDWTVGAKIGALAGSAVPGAGNIVGGIAGFVIGASIYVATDMIDYNGKTARGWLKGVVD